MGEHSLSARMQQKIDTAANWAKATNFVPKKGEIIVYSDGGGVGVPKIKVGDGTTVVGSLKFIESDKSLSATDIETALGYKPEEETPKAQTDTAALGTELISSNGWILGTGWSGNLQSGFTHTSGTAILSYTMPENTINNYYQVSFKSSVAMTDSNLFVSVGNSPLFNLYFEEHDDGTISIGVLAAENGNLSFTPSTDYNGVISEVSIRRVIGTYQPIKQLLDTSGKVSTEIYITPQEQNNLYIGLNAGSLNTTGNRNVGIGANVLKKNLSGWRNIAIGSGALQNNTAGTRNIAIGEDSMPSMQSGQRNIAIGTSTMTLIKNGNRNIAIGADSLFYAEESDDCIGIGFAALNLNKGNTNYGIGTRALYSATGNKNIAIGYDTGHNITSGSENTLVGAAAGYNLKTGKNNVAIGPYAAKGTTNSDQSHYNIAIGYGAAQNIGRYSSYNVVIGPNTATSLSGADHCIVIGANQDVDTDNNYQLNIGGLIKGSLNPNEAFLKINGGLELPNIPSSAPQNIGRIWNDNGVLRIKQEGEENEPYLKTLPIASSSALGGIIAGEGLDITAEGTLSVNKIPNSLTLNGKSYDGSSAVALSSQQLGVPSAFIAKSVSVLDCNSEKIGRVLSSSAGNTLINGPSEIGSTGAGVLWNIPALSAPTSSINESETQQKLYQIFVYDSGKVYLRKNSSNDTATWTYGTWEKLLTDVNITADNITSALGYTPVKDVQVAGTSVMTDGVANVPIASATVPGVVSILSPQDSGIWNDNGSLKVSYATDAEISGRTGTRKAIVCANLDYAVKAAMTDGKGPAWTATEQKAARERMGIDGEYELIEEITISEGTRSLERNLEPDGTAYNFRKMYVSIITTQAEEDGVIYSMFNNSFIGLAMNSIRSQLSEGGIAQIYAHVDNGFLDGYGVGAGNQGTSSNLVRYLTPVNVPSGISAINSIKILANVNIPINTSIAIYGVRA